MPLTIEQLARKALYEEEQKRKRAAAASQKAAQNAVQKSEPTVSMRERTVQMNRDRAQGDSSYAPAGVSRNLYNDLRSGKLKSAVHQRNPLLPAKNMEDNDILLTPRQKKEKKEKEQNNLNAQNTVQPLPIADNKARSTFAQDVANRKKRLQNLPKVQSAAEASLGLPGTKRAYGSDIFRITDPYALPDYPELEANLQKELSESRVLELYGNKINKAQMHFENPNLDPTYTDEQARADLEKYTKLYNDAERYLNKIKAERKDERTYVQNAKADPKFNEAASAGDMKDNIVKRSEISADKLLGDDVYSPHGDDADTNAKYLMMSEEEKRVYNYYLGKNDTKSADLYLKALEPELDRRLGDELSSRIANDKDTVRQTYNILKGAARAGWDTGTRGLAQAFQGEVLEQTPVQQTYLQTSAKTRDSVHGGVNVAADLIFNVGNMAPGIAASTAASLIPGVGAGAASAIGAAVLGTSAGGNAYADAIREGKNEDEAVRYGVLEGFKESALDFVFGKIGTVGGAAMSKLLSKIPVLRTAKSSVSSVIGRLVKNPSVKAAFKASGKYIANAADEGFTEYLQEIVEPIVRNMAFGENNEFKLFSEEALYAAALGAATAGIFNAADIPANYKNAKSEHTNVVTLPIAPQAENTPQLLPTVSQNENIQQNAEQPLPIAEANVAELPILKPAMGIFDKNIGTKTNFASQEDVNNYVDYSYEYAKEQNIKGNKNFPRQNETIVIGKPSERLISDLNSEYGIDVSNAVHVLRDNDIRHIKNSHGEETNEKYPVTANDLKQIPDIVKNYDDVVLIERKDGKKGLYFVKRHNGVTYYLESINSNRSILQNKQMIKVPTGTIPNIKELKDAINKKWNIDSYPNDASIPRMYVQDVPNNVPTFNIPQTPPVVNGQNEKITTKAVPVPIAPQNDNTVQNTPQPLPVAEQENSKNIKQTPNKKEVPWTQAIQDVGKNFYFKDPARVFDAAAGGRNTPLRKEIREKIEEPWLKAKEETAKSMREITNEYREKTKEHNIKSGSKESAAVQWYGEGVRVDKHGNSQEYTLEDLKKEFPEDWENIVKHERLCRKMYDDYLIRTNESLEKVYPNVLEKAQADAEWHETEAQTLRKDSENLELILQDMAFDETNSKNKEGILGERTAATIEEIKNDIYKRQVKYDNLKDKTTKKAMTIADQIDKRQQRLLRIQNEAESKTEVGAYKKQLKTKKQINLLRTKMSTLRAKIKMHEKSAANIRQRIETGDIFQNRRVRQRKDYFHHFQEMSHGFLDLGSFFSDTNDVRIDPQLVGKSETTKPRQKWAAYMQRRNGGRYTADAVGGMLRYIQAAEYKIHMDPLIAKNREIIQQLQDDTKRTKTANNFIEWMTDWTNSMAGKTNPIFDTTIRRLANGRKAVKILEVLNSRAKANAVMGNARSAMAQFLNLPNGMAYIKNPIDIAKGMKAYAKRIVDHNSVINDSAFLNERFIDDVFDQFDEGVLKTPKKFARWLMKFGDQQAANLIWCCAYEQGVREYKRAYKDKGKEFSKSELHELQPILSRYADDITRRSIGGRGIGELPIALQSKTVNFLAPFQVEVNNTYQLIKEKIGEKDAWGLAKFAITSWLCNTITEAMGLGRLIPDIIDATRDVIKGFVSDDEDEERDWSDASYWRDKIFTALQRLTGEMLSYVPFATTWSNFLSDDTRTSLFGEDSDPNRYGTGNIGLNTFLDPLVSLASGKDIDPIDTVSGILLPWGGKQAARTVQGLQDFGVLPDVKVNTKNGVEVRNNSYPTSYSSSGNVRFPMDPNAVNIAKALAFGSFSTKEGNEYINNNRGPLSDKQTEVYKYLTAQGVNGNDVYDFIKDIKDSKKTVWEAKTRQQREKIQDNKFLNNHQKTYVDNMLIGGKSADYLNPETFILSMSFSDDEQLQKAKNINAAGVGAKRVVEIMDSIKNTKSDTDDWGRAVSGSKNKNIVKYVEEQKLTDIQKAAVYKNCVFNSTDDKYALLAREIGLTDKSLGSVYGNISTIEPDKNSQGKTVSGSQNKKINAYLSTLDLPPEQKRLLFAWFASSGKEQKKQRYNVVNNLSILQGDKNAVLQWLMGNKNISETQIKTIFNRKKN